MAVKIHMIRMGLDQCYIIQDKGIIMVDGGSPGKINELKKAMNKFPLRYGENLPVFAEDLAGLMESWRMLLNQGARIIYPAHGKPFPSNVIRKSLS